MYVDIYAKKDNVAQLFPRRGDPFKSYNFNLKRKEMNNIFIKNQIH